MVFIKPKSIITAEGLRMNHRLSFVVEIMRNDIGEVEEEQGIEEWPTEGNERGLVIVDCQSMID